MQITDINGDYIKIGKTSITVKNENGKTRGVVTGCTVIDNTIAPRILFDLSTNFKKHGLSIMDFYGNIILKNGEMFYLHNLSLGDFLDKYAKNHDECFEADFKKQDKQNALRDKAESIGITVINYRK